MGYGWKGPSTSCELSAPLWPGRGLNRRVLTLAQTSGSSSTGDGRVGHRAWGLMGQSLLRPSCCPRLAGKSPSEQVSHPQLPVLLLNGPQMIIQGPCVPIPIGTPRNLALSVDLTFSILCP